MNELERAVRDERIAAIESRANERFGMTPEGPFNCAHYGMDSPDIASICRELLERREARKGARRMTPEREKELVDQCDMLYRRVIAAEEEAKRMREALEQITSPYPRVVHDHDFYEPYLSGMKIRKAREALTTAREGG